MNTIEVSSFDDLEGDQFASQKAKDRIAMILRDDREATLFVLEDWLVDYKPLEVAEGTDQLIRARVEYETEKAWLLTQADPEEFDEVDATTPQTDWVPKSQARQYVASEGADIDTGNQAFLGGYE